MARVGSIKRKPHVLHCEHARLIMTSSLYLEERVSIKSRWSRAHSMTYENHSSKHKYGVEDFPHKHYLNAVRVN
jgi:hypothetical protein